ncbi:MAG: response regulator transcription factor [Bacteroidota bacterium]
MKNILIIEDDPAIVDLLELHLKDMHFQVEKSFHGKEGLHTALKGTHDLIILDIMLPEMDGIEICRTLRAKEVHTPIIMLTARSEEIDKVLGLETGADDYLTKPFSVREFLARVKSVMRRREMDLSDAGEGTPPKNTIVFNELEIDEEKRLVRLNNDRIELTPKEFDLLLLLASNPGRSYSRDKLLNLVWGYEYKGYEHNVNSHINRLRAKIESDLSSPKYILTTWGVGYRFADL